MNAAADAAKDTSNFSIAYAAMNFVVAFIAVTPVFSIAYAAMNLSARLSARLSSFSIAYAAMNSRILAEC